MSDQTLYWSCMQHLPIEKIFFNECKHLFTKRWEELCNLTILQQAQHFNISGAQLSYLQFLVNDLRQYLDQSHYPRHPYSRFHSQFLIYLCHQSTPSYHGFQIYGACHQDYPELWLHENKRYRVFWKTPPTTSNWKFTGVHWRGKKKTTQTLTLSDEIAFKSKTCKVLLYYSRDGA